MPAQCRICGADNPDGLSHCERCGADLATGTVIVCRGCGRENPATNHFCYNCSRRFPRPQPAVVHRVQVGQEPRASPGRRASWSMLVTMVILGALGGFLGYLVLRAGLLPFDLVP
ncbi:MAG: zinc ribbon domain-containing protein [Anaerolineae bacterium]